MNALEEGTPVPPPDPIIAKLLVAAIQNADVFRGMLEIAMCVALPEEVIARPHIAAKLAELDGPLLPPAPASSIDAAWQCYWIVDPSSASGN